MVATISRNHFWTSAPMVFFCRLWREREGVSERETRGRGRDRREELRSEETVTREKGRQERERKSEKEDKQGKYEKREKE